MLALKNWRRGKREEEEEEERRQQQQQQQIHSLPRRMFTDEF